MPEASGKAETPVVMARMLMGPACEAREIRALASPSSGISTINDQPSTINHQLTSSPRLCVPASPSLCFRTIVCCLGAIVFPAVAANPGPGTFLTGLASDSIRALERPPASVWENGVGEGFRGMTESIGLTAGAGVGMAILGGTVRHDLALVSLSYGHMLGGVKGEGHWYRGNWELRGELFSGAQFDPETDWVVGVAPHLRYDFATGSRWIPFVDAGVGVSATGIGPPDLSGTFEFNLQAGAGVHWFVKDDLALTLETRYLHMSCAGLHRPNLGLNTVMGMVGLTWFF